MNGVPKRRSIVEALAYAADFLSEWQRVDSLLSFLEEVLKTEAKKAEDERKDDVPLWLAENVAQNIYWLRGKLSEAAVPAIKALSHEGFPVGPRV